MAIQIHYWSDDVERLLTHYVDVLSFELAYRQPEAGPADFCILKLDDAQLMIAATPSAEMAASRNDERLLNAMVPRAGKPGPISVYIGVADVDAHHERLAAAGANIIEPVWDAPWGLRQFSVLDPDGNLTTFHAV
ncbi:VOC family protein [Candidatus Bipolaricaulota bacterium]|nr:VOC family protein [Candidatus Bipolaricaulota bacterium]